MNIRIATILGPAFLAAMTVQAWADTPPAAPAVAAPAPAATAEPVAAPAAEPANPAAPAGAKSEPGAAAPAAAAPAAAAAAAPGNGTDADTAAARKAAHTLGLRQRSKNGVEVYCKSFAEIGTRMPTMNCYTKEQVVQLQQRTQSNSDDVSSMQRASLTEPNGG